MLDLQNQLYIVYGLFGGCIAMLGIGLIWLLIQMNLLKARIDKLRKAGRDAYAYRNPTLAPDEEVTNRGFVMHTGTGDRMNMPRLTNQGGGMYGMNSQPQSSSVLQPPRAKSLSNKDYGNPAATRDIIPINDRDDRYDGRAFPGDDAVFVDDYRDGARNKSRGDRDSDRYPQYIPGNSTPKNQSANVPRTSHYNDNIMYGGRNAMEQSQSDSRYHNNRGNQMF